MHAGANTVLKGSLRRDGHVRWPVVCVCSTGGDPSLPKAQESLEVQEQWRGVSTLEPGMRKPATAARDGSPLLVFSFNHSVYVLFAFESGHACRFSKTADFPTSGPL